MSAMKVIDELLYRFGGIDSFLEGFPSPQKAVVSQKIEEILNCHVSPYVLCIIASIVETDSYTLCDHTTPLLITKLFRYYYNLATAESQTQNNEIIWKILTRIIESIISYFYKHKILLSEMIWTEIIERNKLICSMDDPLLSTNISLLLLLISCCDGLYGDGLDVFLFQYALDYNPSISDLDGECINMKCIDRILINKNNKNSVNNVSSQIASYYSHSKLRSSEQISFNSLICRIDRLWRGVLLFNYPSLCLSDKSYITIFGSFASNLSDRSSKCIDLYLSVPSIVNDKNFILRELCLSLNKFGLSCSGIIDCTLPSISCTNNDDSNINICYDEYNDKEQMLHLINALCDYNNDLRIRSLILCIKNWSKKRNINSWHNKYNNKSRLSSFCFMLLIFKYLQSKHILPILKKERRFNRYNVVLDIDNKKKKKKKRKKHKLSLSKLVSGFFQFYTKFDYHKYAISLFHRDIVEKKGSYRDLNQRELPTSRLLFVIEYPLQTNYNCSMNLTKENAILFKIECIRANIILKSKDASLDHLWKSPI